MNTTRATFSVFTLLTLLTAFALTNSKSVADSIPPGAPDAFPGKEYSNHRDQDFSGTPDPHQVIKWDGTGGADDTFDFSDALIEIEVTEEQVDAIANRTDRLYFQVSHADAVTMVTSMEGDPDIYYTAAGHHGVPHGSPPDVGVWADATQINSISLPDDVDGLEIWGPAEFDDAQKFSLIGDPATGVGIGRVSIWNYTPGTNATPYVMAAEIAQAIGRDDLEDVIDVDALMVGDSLSGGNGEFPNDEIRDVDDTFEQGDSIMFSIAPVDEFDGGEIWVWDVGAGPAQFLEHGGEIWNTDHDVMGHFGSNSENINALEAIPEPSSLPMLLIAVAFLGKRLRRRW